MDNIETFIEKFTEAVDFQEPIPITPESNLHEMPEWDSLAALGVIVMFNMEYSKTITGEDLKSCGTINDLYKLSA
jgi:acyl carrier protein